MPKLKLPNKLLLLPNPDKKHNEKWFKGRALGNIPCPFRGIIAATVDSGKTTVIKNLLLYADPLYDRLVIVCCDKSTKDYEDLEPHLVTDQLPTVESFDPDYKNCLIIDDFRAKNVADKNRLDRLFGYASSHRRTTVIMAVQDLFAIWTPTIQRMSDLFVLWQTHDDNQFRMICNRVGMKENTVNDIFSELDFGQKDSLMIDKTAHTPAPLRKNIFDKIEFELEPNVQDKETPLKKKPKKKISK